MITKLFIALIVVLGSEALLDSTNCSTAFRGVCHCGMAYSVYDNFKEKKFTVNCTNTGFTDVLMLMDLPVQTQVLIFVGNSIPSLPANVFGNTKDYNDLEVIDMSNNHIRFIQGKSFHKVFNVKTLILDHNDLDITNEKARPRILSNFESLERLHMTNAFTEKINASEYMLNLEDIFYESDLSYLKVLHLEQNEIWSIGENEKVFCQLVAIEQILLGDNRLTNFDFTIDCLPDLRYIDLERNMISRLTDDAMTKLDAFVEKKNGSRLQIKLDANPFDCDCRLKKFLQWLKTTNVDIMHWKDYDCIDGYPQVNVGKTFGQILEVRCPVSSSSSSSNNSGRPNSKTSTNTVREHTNANTFQSAHHYDGDGHYTGYSSATIGVLAFLLVFTTSLLLAVGYFQRQKIKNLLLPYWDFVTRKIGYTGIANDEAPQEVNV